MSHRIPWIVKSVLLALAVVTCVAVMTGLSTAAHTPDGSGATVSTVNNASSPESKPAEDAGATPASPKDDDAGSTAACKRAPECSVDSDCDAICGVGLGKCVHSNCPVRVCHCR